MFIGSFLLYTKINVVTILSPNFVKLWSKYLVNFFCDNFVTNMGEQIFTKIKKYQGLEVEVSSGPQLLVFFILLALWALWPCDPRITLIG